MSYSQSRKLSIEGGLSRKIEDEDVSMFYLSLTKQYYEKGYANLMAIIYRC